MYLARLQNIVQICTARIENALLVPVWIYSKHECTWLLFCTYMYVIGKEIFMFKKRFCEVIFMFLYLFAATQCSSSACLPTTYCSFSAYFIVFSRYYSILSPNYKDCVPTAWPSLPTKSLSVYISHGLFADCMFVCLTHTACLPPSY